MSHNESPKIKEHMCKLVCEVLKERIKMKKKNLKLITKMEEIREKINNLTREQMVKE
jgi:pyridoxal/pyridoxine/pyridoxamine kinase